MNRYYIFGCITGKERRLCNMSPYGPAKGPHEVPVGEAATYMSMYKAFNMPQLVSFFPHAESVEDIQTVRNLTDHAQWISAFRDNPTVLTDTAIIPLPKTSTYGPVELLRSLKPEERQAIYAQYVDTFVPLEVQEKIGIPSWSTKKPLEKYQAIVQSGKMKILNAALGGIIGLTDWNAGVEDAEKDEAEALAKDSLLSYYEMNNPDMPDYVSDGAQDDYARAIQFQRNTGMSVIATDPQKLQERLQPSRFKGALAMGIFDRPWLDHIAGGLKEREHDIRLAQQRVNRNLAQLTESQERGYTKEAETLRDTFMKMGGAEKLIFTGIALYGLWDGFLRKKEERTWFGKTFKAGGVILTAAYFFQKLILKQEDPVKGWTTLLNGARNISPTNIGAYLNNENAVGEVADAAVRTNSIFNFLDDYSTKQIERQAIGFGILYDMPVDVLARHFSLSGPDGQNMHFDIQNPHIHDVIESTMEKRGWDRTKYMSFFADPENVHQLTEAMGYVFFAAAARKQENMHDVQFILETLRILPPGTSISIFGQVAAGEYDHVLNTAQRDRFIRAHQLYVRLVAEGHGMSLSDTNTLGSFMTGAEGVTDVFSLMQADPVPSADVMYDPSDPVPSASVLYDPFLSPVIHARTKNFKNWASGSNNVLPHSPLPSSVSGVDRPPVAASGSDRANVVPSGTPAPGMPREGVSVPPMPESGESVPGDAVSGESVPGDAVSGEAVPPMPESGESVPGDARSGTQRPRITNEGVDRGGSEGRRGTDRPGRIPQRGSNN